MGVEAAQEIADEIGETFRARVVEMDGSHRAYQGKLKTLLAQPAEPIRFAATGPTVIMVAGVNGCGKTTSIAKLTQHVQADGKRVVLGAADTFRAAAVEQLTIWASRLGAEIVTGALGQRSGQRGPSRRGPGDRNSGPTCASSTRPAGCKRSRT